MSNKSRKKTELEKNIYEDIKTEIQKLYDSEDVEYKNEDPKETITNFFSYLYRLIPVTKREVHYSKELLERIRLKKISEEYVEILKKFNEAFLEGKNMCGFLSNNIKKSQETDFLLYTWNLFHLHMSDKFIEDKKQMKNNRSNTQLLCIINWSDVYFIDVISHPVKPEEYFNIETLEIIAKNGWMEKIGFYEITDAVPGTLKDKITEGKEIFDLYSQYSINIPFEIQGKIYIPCSGAINTTRRPIKTIDEAIEINRKIQELNNIEGTYEGFQLVCNRQEVLGSVKFRTQMGEEEVPIFKKMWKGIK